MEGAVGKPGARNADVAFTTAKTPVLGSRNRSDTWRERQELRKIPSIQRQIVDGLCFDHRAQIARRALKHHGFRVHHHLFGDGADLQPYGLRDRLIDTYVEWGNLHDLEALGLDGQNISSWLEVDENEVAVGICRDSILNLGGLVGKLDRGASDKSTGLVRDRAIHFACSRLRASSVRK